MIDFSYFMRRIRNIIKWGLTAYISLYVGLSTHVLYDFSTKHNRWLYDNARNELVIKGFSATLDDKVRYLTFLGETHTYNYRESDFARDYVKQFNLVLSEGGYDNKASNIDKAFWAVVKPLRNIVESYMALADGRFNSNPDLNDFAYQNRIPILYLENDTAGGASGFSVRQKGQILSAYFYGAAMGPYLYYLAKESEIHPQSTTEKTFDDSETPSGKIVNVGPRNIQMSNEILKYLMSRPESKVLIVVGKGHLDGLIRNLKANTSLHMENLQQK